MAKTAYLLDSDGNTSPVMKNIILGQLSDLRERLPLKSELVVFLDALFGIITGFVGFFILKSILAHDPGQTEFSMFIRAQHQVPPGICYLILAIFYWKEVLRKYAGLENREPLQRLHYVRLKRELFPPGVTLISHVNEALSTLCMITLVFNFDQPYLIISVLMQCLEIPKLAAERMFELSKK